MLLHTHANLTQPRRPHPTQSTKLRKSSPEREHAEVIGPGEDDQLLCGLLATPFWRADDAAGAAEGDLHSAGVGNAPMSTYGATRGITAAPA